MRDLLRKYETDPVLRKKMDKKHNDFGESPVEMSHNVKYELTDSSDDDETKKEKDDLLRSDY